jgi:hypothetical protein
MAMLVRHAPVRDFQCFELGVTELARSPGHTRPGLTDQRVQAVSDASEQIGGRAGGGEEDAHT